MKPSRVDGILSNRNAEIDYARGLIRFEAAPDDGAETVIDATWKQDYRYRRPDALIRNLLENQSIHTKLGLNTENSAFAIEQALVRHSTDPVFSSHGHPNFEREGLTKWLKRDETTKKVYLLQDTALIEYDEKHDAYSPITAVPEDTTITEIPPGDYGEYLPDEDVTLTVPPDGSIQPPAVWRIPLLQVIVFTPLNTMDFNFGQGGLSHGTEKAIGYPVNSSLPALNQVEVGQSEQILMTLVIIMDSSML